MNAASDRYREVLLDRFSRSVDELLDSHTITDFSQDALEATTASALAGVREANRLNAQLGPFYSSDRVRTLLGGISRQAVTERVAGHRLLRVETSDGKLLFPAFQFQPTGEVRPRLAALLQTLLATGENSWTVAYWLTTPLAQFEGRTALDVLDSRRADEIEDLMDLAADDAASWRRGPRGEV
ncbi:antitoxin Xre/MbcA/ParS toxin-binding domain-containing protein [Rathayibacter iranicus]|uniref:DUF2384 domain-containing protein n=2 Tax=Rathayibacter iranicus TaxID=59737 RepID=A0AAD1AG82_9MICO|nr:antitoxin Xre/MbcA/ParS toxin-binding domain-containing protein [Rathayibacter iranicus]AZZ56650.1 DUF2384 domain-containing protein [Rathayibacter iranicus]MWV31314.1 DUF2384 domain-containing protein [Rathayibacter iranicus NCPPB 2253 = VKM Ac-1602]PPI43295.1 hypothetical protein C5E09_11700 [Rathayibacter iranicus]PPI58238.1 hypothetical protein C5E08_12615 [Rathayibacter iranicus]PPI69451.1 hypothetical protein C5E01_11660 [Rathayibacter iranicus]